MPVSARTSAAASAVDALQEHPTLGPQIVHARRLPPSPGRRATLDPPLPAALEEGLAALGIRGLWAHQAQGIAAARRGENVLVTTPTASGKSLVFHLPVLEAALEGRADRALFLYPLKALGRDQQGKLEALAAAAGLEPVSAIYDGDTDRAVRARVRRRPPRVLVTNPDMAHLGILGGWHRWEVFLRDLRWIVLDELHTYRGIFGCHFHHVLQRLLRVSRQLGAEPRVIASSATAANADEFAGALAGEGFRWIHDSGAPREGRHVALLQPDASPYTLVLRLLVFCIERGLKTIVFTKARRITELLYSWLSEQEPDLARRVASYRAGFLPEERRGIEARLASGELDAVISTSALEMGIDVGGLDACILVGFPGSIMATWQRSGRVGRRGREGVTFLVALPDALDQYFLAHPDELLGRPCETLVVDPANETVSRDHLLCAAAEAPLDPGRDREYLAPHGRVIEDLVAEGELVRGRDGRSLISRRRRPHRGVAIRGGGATYSIVQEDTGEVIGTVDGVRVLHECHPGAVYLHGGRQYEVRSLELGEALVLVHPARVDYYTNALAEKDTRILEVLEASAGHGLDAWLGRLEVTERIVGYERKRIYGGEVLSQHEIELAPVHFTTVGLWWAVPPPLEEALRRAGRHVLGSLHASEHATIGLFPLLALCDRGDIGGISMPFHPQVGCACVFVYDGHPGGVGIAKAGFGRLRELLERVRALVAGCECDDGCPSCIVSPKCGNGNRPLDKPGAVESLELVLGGRDAAAWELTLHEHAS